MRPLVILRPQPGASATADLARRLHLTPILMPLFRIEPVDWTAPDPSRFDALLITSANAIRFGGVQLQKLKTLPVHAVGEVSADAARNVGFTVQSTGRSGVEALLQQIPPELRLLHLCGADRREPGAPSQTITVIPVYRSAALPLPDNFSAIDSAVVVVHSPRAAEHLAALARKAGSPRNRTAIAAISAEAAAAAGDGWQRVETADEPNERALLALAARLCHNAPR